VTNLINDTLSYSTGLNMVCGDIRPINYLKRFAWHSTNLSENYLPDRTADPSLEIKDNRVPPNELIPIIHNCPKGKILPRALCDILWRTFPWHDLEKRLGRIRVLDIGYGGGRLFLECFAKIPLLSSNLVYEGVDIKANSNWNELQKNPNVILHEDDICSFLRTNDPDFNVVVSQSALEHIKFDFYIHKLLARHIDSCLKHTLQIHLVPSRACHGL